MSLLTMDGFDYYGSTQFNEKWSNSSGALIGTGAGRRGGGAAQLGSGAFLEMAVSNPTTLVCGIAYKTATLPTLGDIFKFIDTGTTQISIKVNSAGALLAYLGDSTTLLGTSAAGTVVAGSYYYIEAKVLISDTVGTVTVVVTTPSKVVGTALTITVADTKASSNARITTLGIYGATVDAFYDDFYLLDTLGSVRNDFLGDSRVDLLVATEDGTYAEFTPSTGSDLYAVVDETPRSTDYLLGDTVLAQASFKCTKITSVSGSIAGVQVNVVAKKMDSNPASVQPLIHAGATDSYGASHTLTTSDTSAHYIVEVDPETSITWTERNINSAEFGVRML